MSLITKRIIVYKGLVLFHPSLGRHIVKEEIDKR